MKKYTALIALLLSLVLLLSACDFISTTPPNSDPTPTPEQSEQENNGGNTENSGPISLDNIPAFDGKTPYVTINDGKPFFTDEDMVTTSYESYAELDSLGRCGVTIASIGKDIMPTEERGSIGSVKPSGWVTVKYDIVDGKYLYNRCHLIGYQLTGENANRQNLITGTRYMNVDGMLPFENMVAYHIVPQLL